MKSEIYNALATLNRGFDAALESLTILQQEGVITPDYLQQKTEVAEEMRAGLNHLILNKLGIRERDDLDHYGKLRLTTEARLPTTTRQKLQIRQ